jgi:hypothetical protein
VRIGDIHDVAGDRTAARDVWHKELSILDELGQPDADEVRARLRRPSGQPVGQRNRNVRAEE